jgi:hypothetical protein
MRNRVTAPLAKTALAGLAMAIALAIWAAPGAALAQEGGDMRTDEATNRYSEALGDLGAVTAVVEGTDRFCPSVKFKAALSRPIGAQNAVFDETSTFEIRKELLRFSGNALGLNDASECSNFKTGEHPVELQRVFAAHSPSPSIISVIYTVFRSSPFDAHPYTEFEAFTFDLAKSRELTLDDIIPPESSPQALEALWAEAAKGWCAYNDHHTLPSFYGLFDDGLCSKPESAPLPPALAQDRSSLKALGNAYLTSEGLALRLAPSDGWSYAEGPSELVLKKGALVKFGAKASIWHAKK